MFGKIPKYRVELICFGIIGYSDGSWVPNPKPFTVEAYFNNPDHALQYAFIMANFQPGCQTATMYEGKREYYTHRAPLDKKSPGIDVPGSMISAGGKKPCS